MFRGEELQRHDGWKAVRRWLAGGLDLLFPPRCALCRAETDPWHGVPAGVDPGNAIPGPFCQGCVAEIVSDRDRCPRCGAPSAQSPCRACGGDCRDWDGIVVLGGYGGILREAVLRSKRPGGHDILLGLGRLLHIRQAATLREWDDHWIVPVPMHWWRRTTRGASAAEALAHRLGQLTSTPVLGALRRRRATVMQNRLPVEERRGNVRHAFALRHRGVAGRRVLLVDDVVTTGGTLSACGRVLREAGATAVHVAVIARADHAGDDGDH